MNRDKLFECVAQKWPFEMSIRDATPMGETAFMCKTLSRQYDEINKSVGTEYPWLDIGCWAFHQALWVQAKKNYARHVYVVRKSEVTVEQFDRFLRANLEDESWSQERREYLKLNQ